MTAPGAAYARFRRALDGGNATAARAAAAELQHVGLSDALELCLLLLEREPGRYPRAALRWHARYCRETRGVGLDEGLAVLALLAALESRPDSASRALAELLDRRDAAAAAGVLGRWADARAIV